MAKEKAMTDIVERLREWKPGDKQSWCDEAATTIETLRRERDDALREASKQARAAGEAIGKLEMSEMAGIVEGWIAYAKRAERERDEARERAAELEAREAVVRAKALEEAEITACEAFDVMTTARPMPNLRNHIRRSIRALAESEARNLSKADCPPDCVCGAC